jgi:hypothetical protein
MNRCANRVSARKNQKEGMISMNQIEPDFGPNRRSSETTKHPGICLFAFFFFLVGTALLVHVVFQALLKSAT